MRGFWFRPSFPCARGRERRPLQKPPSPAARGPGGLPSCAGAGRGVPVSSDLVSAVTLLLHCRTPACVRVHMVCFLGKLVAISTSTPQHRITVRWSQVSLDLGPHLGQEQPDGGMPAGVAVSAASAGTCAFSVAASQTRSAKRRAVLGKSSRLGLASLPLLRSTNLR